MSTIEPTPAMLAARGDIIAAMQRHTSNEEGDGKMNGIEMLAVIAYTVGQLIALQDKNKVDSAIALKIVTDNIQLGNAQAIATIALTQGHA